MASKVYFTRTITPEKVVEMFDLLGKKLPGKRKSSRPSMHVPKRKKRR